MIWLSLGATQKPPPSLFLSTIQESKNQQQSMALLQHPILFTTLSKPSSCHALPNRCTSSSSSSGSSRRRREFVVCSSGSLGARWDEWRKGSVPCLSDVIWPSAGSFAAMAVLGRLDQLMAPKGLSLTVAPLGAVCAVLFATPNSPAAQKYNMFVAQIGCAAIGVLALAAFGPSWLARATALSASVAFMIITGTTHPPAASLPIMFIDGAKFHKLHLWYALFPGFTGCLLLCLIQEMVIYMKNHYKF